TLLQAGYRLELEKVRRARRLITVSRATRDALLSALRVDPEKIAVTYEAAELAADEPDPSVLERNGISGPYFLYVGAAYPYKNLSRLIDAFALSTDDSQLVLAGYHEQFARELAEQAKARGIGERVVFPGRVSDPELAALYDSALAYVFV